MCCSPTSACRRNAVGRRDRARPPRRQRSAQRLCHDPTAATRHRGRPPQPLVSMVRSMTPQVPLVDYLVLGDEPHLVANECTQLRRPLLRPPQRLRQRAAAPSSRTVDVATDGRGAGVHDRALRRARRAGAVRGRRSSTATAPACAANVDQRRARPRARARSGMKVRLATFVARHRRRRHRGHRLRLRAGLNSRTTGAWHERRRLDPRDPHDQVRQAPRQGHRRPRRRGGARRAGRRRRDDEATWACSAAGNLMDGARPASASSCRSRSARPASPSTTWPTRAPPAPPRCARRSWRSRPARPTWASPSASRSWPAPACSAGGAGKGDDADTWTPERPLRRGRRRSTAASAPRRCPACSPRSAWSTAHKYGGIELRAVRQDREKNHAHSTLNPLAAYQKRFTLDEIMDDVMIAYPNTRPMCSANCDGAAAAVVVSGAKLQDAVARAAAARGQDLGVGAHHRPVARRRARCCPTSTR